MGAWFQTTADPRHALLASAYRKTGLLNGAYAFTRMALCPLLDIESALPNAGTIVDVGCGSGQLLQWLALGELASDRRLVGLEIDAGRVALGNRVCADLGIADRIELKIGRLEDAAGQGADAVCFVDVLHHIEFDQQQQMIATACESLGDRGMLLIKDVGTRPRLKYWYNYAFDAMTHVTSITQGEVGYYRSSSGWENLVREQGFAARSVPVNHVDLAAHVMIVGERP